MTPRRGEAGRGLGASRDEGRASAGTVLGALLLGAFVLRLIIAYVLFPDSGFKVDIGSFQSWAVTLARYGPGGFYEHAGFADYTPGYLYLLWLVGLAAQALGDLTGRGAYPFAAELIKVPAIVFDLALGYLIYRTLRGWTGERAALIGAALYLFNPVTWYESALWGQVDAVGTFVLLGAVLLLVAGWSEAATAAAVLAAVVKPQYGIGLLIVGFVLLARHLLRPGSGPVPTIRHPLLARIDGLLGGWFTAEQGPWRLVSSAALGMATLFVLIAPFDLAHMAAGQAVRLPIGGDLGGLLAVVGQAATEYHYLTVNAYNLWALVGPTSLAQAGLWTSDLEPAIGAVPWVVIGSLLLAITLAFLAYQLLRRDDRSSIVVTATVLAVAFFVVPTRVHERYLFPAFAFGALLAGGSRAWRWWYIALAVVNAANLHAILTNSFWGTENVGALPLGAVLRSAGMVSFIAIAHTALFAWALWHVRPALDDVVGFLRGRRPTGDRATFLGPSAVDGAPASPPFLAAGPPPAGPSGGGQPSPPATAPPSWEEQGLEPPRFVEALGRRLAISSLRPDRSRLLHGEGPGRVDRLDLLALVLIVVVGLGLRLFRADQPFQMVTLDEVYHARTATEFLQDWRYGIFHPIYEWTHPHLAKYLMAAGIVALGDNRVVGTSALGAPVESAAVERRYVSLDEPGMRAGDRLFVATGATVRVIDLQSGQDEAGIGVLASTVAVDENAHRVYLGGASGAVWSLETTRLDAWRAVGGDPQELQPVELARLDGPVRQLWAVSADRIVARVGDHLEALDPTTGEVLARRTLAGLNAAVPIGAVSSVVAQPAAIADPVGEAQKLATLLGVPEAQLEEQLRRSVPAGGAGVRVASYLSTDQRTGVQSAIDDGQLPGIEIDDRVALAAALPQGLAVVDATSLDTIAQVPLAGAALGLDLMSDGDQTLYVALAGAQVQLVTVPSDAPPMAAATVAMPGPVRDVRWNPATDLVHVLGETARGQPTVYVIETRGNAVFADAQLPFRPVAWALDVQPDDPSADRERLLLFGADGSTAAVDAGHNAFAWRFPGVVLGVLTAAALYLLARFLFRRRSVALLAAAAALTDGMFFAHSRDAMNDAYVGFFIVAAFAVLAWLALPASGKRGPLAVALGLPLVGLLLGLALAAKWAGAFAVGAAVLVVLLRSALGRLVGLIGMIVLAGVLGHLAIASGNWSFALLMIALALLMAAGMAWRPIAFSLHELRYAGLAPIAAGAAVLLAQAAGISAGGQVAIAGVHVAAASSLGVALVGAGAAAWLALRFAAERGWIALSRDLPPSVTPDDAPSPPPRGWLRPGSSGGLPFTYALFCLAVVPLVVYLLSYVPWARPWDPACASPMNDCPQIIPATIAPDGTTIGEGWPPGHRGQTLLDLTVGMYDYHNGLRATHPATSPWWAWPFDLKPVWLFQGSYGQGMTGVIFDVGNLVTFWLSVPALGFGLWQAWRRRSLALTFVAVAFLGQWLSWARIDRVLFQYHYYSALPFAFLFLAYFLAELWNGPSRGTWLLARVGAAVAILGPGLLWLAKDPLCAVAGVTSVDPGSYLCTGASGSITLPQGLLAGGLIVILGVGVLAWELLRSAAQPPGAEAMGAGPPAITLPGLLRIVAIVLLTGLGVTVVPRLVGSGGFTITGSVGQAWVVGIFYLAGAAAFAWLTLGARDPRRYVAVALVTAAAWFVLFYPYLSDLPLPGGTPYIYQRLLPTFDYSFQFAVNTQPAPAIALFNGEVLLLTVSIAAVAAVASMLVAQWRVERRARVAANGREAAQP